MYRKEKKIPTLLAFLILLTGIATATYLDKNPQKFTSQAYKIPLPEDIHFTNISDTSFAISWLTASPTIGTIIVTHDGKKWTLLDDLDSDAIPRPRVTHVITVKNLLENTSVSIKIINGTDSCREEKQCPTLSQKTGIKLPSLLPLPPAKGSLFTKDGKSAYGAIVYMTVGKNAPLSGRVDSTGLWVIPLIQLRTQDFLSRPDISDSDIVQITAKFSTSEISSAVIDIKSIRQNVTIPQMTIGNSYNFIDLMSKKDALAALYPPQQNILGAKTEAVFDILFPKYDDDTTPDTRPRIRGAGKPGNQFTITLESSPQTGKVVVLADGTWNWRPPKELSPGLHHLTITGYDEKGNLITATRKFIVLKSGEQVLGDATVSASLTPTITMLPTTSPTTIPSLTLSPILSPTLTPIFLSPTLSPTPSPFLPTASLPPPRSGTTAPTVFLIGTSILLLLAGSKLLMFL